MTVERITKNEIDEIRRRHILANLLYTPIDAAGILKVSVRQVFELIKDGDLEAANKAAANGKQATKGTRITAESLEKHRKSIIVPKDKWKE